MIVKIVAIISIVHKFDCTIVTILTIHGLFPHDLHDRRSVTVECIKPGDGFFVFISVVTDSMSPNLSQSNRLLKLLVIFLYFMKTESHSNFGNRFSLLRYCPLRIQLS